MNNILTTEIIPGVLDKDWPEIEKKIEAVLPFAKSLHIDLLDGVFAPNKSFQDPKPFAKYSNKLTLELHMMVKDPIDYLDAWSEIGVRRFIGQVEMMKSQVKFVAKAEALGEVGLAIDSQTPVSGIEVPLMDLDFIFVMTVKAGFSNQAFLPECLKKVEHLRGKTQIPIEVDGGINDETIQKAYKAGANRFVSTGYIFGGDTRERFNNLVGLTTPNLSG